MGNSGHPTAARPAPPVGTLSRRALLGGGLAAWFLPGAAPSLARALFGARSDAVFLGALPFLREGDLWVDVAGPDERRFGSGLGGRKIFDLETLAAGALDVPSSRFFLRTFRPDDLGEAATWSVRLQGLVRRPAEIPIAELIQRARPRGSVLLECSGNSGEHRFGLISAAPWDGVPVEDVLARCESLPEARAIEIVGDDSHVMPSLTSMPGASWIFTREQLRERSAFLATGMNGERLMRDHGAPVRLVVPGWYGCACIKWVRELRLLPGDVRPSSQMREFAARTHQDGVPELALDFAPAAVDPAAMPVRVEAWRRRDGVSLAIVGVAWGEAPAGTPAPRRWSIRCGELPWQPIARFVSRPVAHGWRLWRHTLHRVPPGELAMRLRVDDAAVRTRRLARGYYTRTVEVPA